MNVPAALVEIAHSRGGLTEIKVNGSEEFRRAVWLEANVQGIEFKGYEPKETDLATLEKLSMQKALWEKKPEDLVKEHPELSNEAVTLKLAEKVLSDFQINRTKSGLCPGLWIGFLLRWNRDNRFRKSPRRSRGKLVQER